MFWSKPGAEHILALRCIQAGHNLHAYWRDRPNSFAAANDSLALAAYPRRILSDTLTSWRDVFAIDVVQTLGNPPPGQRRSQGNHLPEVSPSPFLHPNPKMQNHSMVMQLVILAGALCLQVAIRQIRLSSESMIN